MSRLSPTTDDRASHARARETLAERAREYMQRLGREPNPRERFWFVVDAFQDDLYRPGESAPVLAEVWGFAVNTIEHTACKVKDALGDPARLEDARSHIALEARRRSDELYQRGNSAEDRAAGAIYSASNAALETYGKVTGALSSGPTVNVLVDQRGAIRPELGGVLVAACETAAAMGLDPRAFRDALAGRLASSLPTAAVMALPAPACASPADRARELVAALCEVMPEVDDVSEVRPALLAMVADDE